MSIELMFTDEQWADLEACAEERGVPVNYLIIAAVMDDLVR